MPEPPPLHAHKRVLGVLGFAALATQLVAGGPWGLELSVKEAGPGPVFLCFLLLPIVFSLPQALITAELSTLFDDNGGVVTWVRAAFGDFAAWIVGVNAVIGAIVDLALYPLLVSEYVGSAFVAQAAPHSTAGALRSQGTLPVPHAGVAPGGPAVIASNVAAASPAAASAPLQIAVFLAVVALGFGINVRGIRDVSFVSGAAFAFMMLPFVLSLVAQLPKVLLGLSALVQVAPRMNAGAFFSTMLWGYTGWASLGALAGEVRDPATTYPKGTALTLLAVTACYGLPCLVSVTTHPDYWNWHNGSLSRFTGDVGAWLSALCLFASVICQISVFTAGLATSARTVWALAGGGSSSESGTSGSGSRGPSSSGSSSSSGTDRPSPSGPMLPRVLAIELGSSGAPVVALAAHCLVIAGMVLFPFASLVQADMLLACVPLLGMVAAFVRLRYLAPPSTRRARSRQYIVPYGWRGVAGLVVPKLAVLTLALASSSGRTWLVALALNAAAVLFFAWRWGWGAIGWAPQPDALAGVIAEGSTAQGAPQLKARYSDRDFSEESRSLAHEHGDGSMLENSVAGSEADTSAEAAESILRMARQPLPEPDPHLI